MRAVRKLLVAITILLIILQAPLVTCAEKPAPAIEVYKLLSWPLTVRVYVESRSIDITTGEEFNCPAKDKVILAFYDALTRLRKSILRFSDEYPKYVALVAVTFMNVSSPEDADLILVVMRGWNVSRALLYKGVDPRRANEIQITCKDAQEFSLDELRGIIMHELLHAFGVGHAHQMWTDRGEPEVMLNIQPDAYPTTLDLYAIYMVYFGRIDFAGSYKTNITLPKDMEYKMVVPYDVEVQRLREANERLRSEVDDLWKWLRQANDVIKEFEEANRNLSRENAELRAINEALQEQLAETWAELQLTKQVLEHYEEENQVLKQRLLDVAQVGLTMAQRFNETMVELIRENSMLKANLTAALEYARSMETSFNFLRAAVLILCAAALTFVILYLRTMERREAEEEEMPPERQR